MPCLSGTDCASLVGYSWFHIMRSSALPGNSTRRSARPVLSRFSADPSTATHSRLPGRVRTLFRCCSRSSGHANRATADTLRALSRAGLPRRGSPVRRRAVLRTAARASARRAGRPRSIRNAIANAGATRPTPVSGCGMSPHLTTAAHPRPRRTPLAPHPGRPGPPFAEGATEQSPDR